MTITTTVTPDSVADRLGLPRPGLDSPLERQWQVWIDQAVRQIARYQQRHSLPDPDPDTVDDVVLEAVADMANHPDRSTQVTVAVDDASTSRSYVSSLGRVSIDDALWDQLWPDQSVEGAFSIRPSFQPDRPRWCW